MILLDSNAFIWLLNNKNRVGPKATARIEAADGVFISVVSIWELGIKHLKNKERQPISINELIRGADALGASILNLQTSHLNSYARIMLPQKDPFDRLLVAQAQAEGCIFLTSDQHILASKYNVLDARL